MKTLSKKLTLVTVGLLALVLSACGTTPEQEFQNAAADLVLRQSKFYAIVLGGKYTQPRGFGNGLVISDGLTRNFQYQWTPDYVMPNYNNYNLYQQYGQYPFANSAVGEVNDIVNLINYIKQVAQTAPQQALPAIFRMAVFTYTRAGLQILMTRNNVMIPTIGLMDNNTQGMLAWDIGYRRMAPYQNGVFGYSANYRNTGLPQSAATSSSNNFFTYGTGFLSY